MYEHFFGLEDEPFRLTPDPRYLFLSPKHAEALAHLRLGLRDSSGFVCITGEIGTGKTTLLRTFLSELGPNVDAAYIFSPPQTALDLVRRVCREFGCPVTGQRPLIEDLHAYLIDQHQAGRVCVLVLDEAQALSIDLLEQIRLLLNLETETWKLLRIVLVGQPQLRTLLLNPGLAQLNQRITLRWHLGPLSYPETVAYVEHRLSVASGGRPVRLFTRPALRLLHSVSGGVPRLVNMVAHRALLAAYIDRQTIVNRHCVAQAYHEIQAVPLPGTLSPIRKVALAVTGLAMGIALVAFSGPLLDRLFNPRPGVAAPAPSSARTLPQVDVPLRPTPSPAEPGPASAVVASSAPVPAPEPVQLVSAADLARRVSSLNTETSARTATDAILHAWGARPLDADEARLPNDLESVAWRRGLQTLLISGNRSMLRLLDLPAVLAIRVPGTPSLRYAALTRMDASRAVLTLDGVPTMVDAALLDQFWSGQAQVLWRDFDGLGPMLRRGTRGVAVVHLQEMLRRVGALQHDPTGVFDVTTEAAVLGFQRAHLLDPDGLVGPLTGIALYSIGGNHQRPALGGEAPASS